jgi:hypothetical protein
MQAQQRRIPISGGDAKNKNWEEMLPHYEAELAALKANTELLKNSDKQEAVEIQPVANADVKLKGAWQRVVYGEGISPFVDRKELVVEAVAPELKGMQGFVFNGEQKRTEATTFEFSCTQPVKLLVGYFKGDNKRFAQAPKLEIDASANDYGQAEPVLQNAVTVKGWGVANIHAYHFEAGEHSITLPRGFLLVAGFTADEMKSRNVGLAGSDDTPDWLFY